MYEESPKLLTGSFLGFPMSYGKERTKITKPNNYVQIILMFLAVNGLGDGMCFNYSNHSFHLLKLNIL